MTLTKEQLQRYARNIIIPDIGAAGQEKLLKAKMLIVGAGGLGSSASFYLAAAGVGKIGLIDSDVVESDNLQRQILHTNDDIGKKKVDSAKEKLNRLNPGIEVFTYSEEISCSNVLNIISGYDLVLECSDNFSTKYLLNDSCVIAGKPLFYAAVLRFEGQAITILPRKSACLRCVFSHPPKEGELISPKEAGILGAVAGLGGVIQANEAIKYVIEAGTLLTGKLLVFDVLGVNFKKVKVQRNSKCLVCGQSPQINEIKEDNYRFK